MDNLLLLQLILDPAIKSRDDVVCVSRDDGGDRRDDGEDQIASMMESGGRIIISQYNG